MTRLTARKCLRPVSRQGFTLTEVLLVLAILGVIAAMVVPNLLGRQREANNKITRSSIKALEDAAEQYAVSHDGELPTNIQELMNTGTDTHGKPISPYLKSMPMDAWNKPLHYEFPNTKSPNATGPAIWSDGADRIPADGGGDDVTNWKQQ